MSIPTWCSEFVGQPYKEDGWERSNGGYDCWGLIRAVYSHVFDIEVSDWGLEVVKGCWRLVGDAERHTEGDMLVFTPDGVNHHVGIVADPGRMLHAAENLGQVIVEPYKVSIWKHQLKRVYRHDLL